MLTCQELFPDLFLKILRLLSHLTCSAHQGRHLPPRIKGGATTSRGAAMERGKCGSSGEGGSGHGAKDTSSPGHDRMGTVQCSACDFQNEVWACPVHGMWSCLCPRAGLAGGQGNVPPMEWQCQMCGARSTEGRLAIAALAPIDLPAAGDCPSSHADATGPSPPSTTTLPRQVLPIDGSKSRVDNSTPSGRTASSSSDGTPDWARTWIREHPWPAAAAAPPMTAADVQETGATSSPTSILPALTPPEFPLCCLCGLCCDDIFGHNPDPLPAVYFSPPFCRALQDGSGRVIQHVCCSRCNYNRVVPARRSSALATTNPVEGINFT